MTPLPGPYINNSLYAHLNGQHILLRKAVSHSRVRPKWGPHHFHPRWRHPLVDQWHRLVSALSSHGANLQRELERQRKERS
jgi:hypothetical protein